MIKIQNENDNELMGFIKNYLFWKGIPELSMSALATDTWSKGHNSWMGITLTFIFPEIFQFKIYKSNNNKSRFIGKTLVSMPLV